MFATSLNGIESEGTCIRAGSHFSQKNKRTFMVQYESILGFQFFFLFEVSLLRYLTIL